MRQLVWPNTPPSVNITLDVVNDVDATVVVDMSNNVGNDVATIMADIVA